MKLEHSLADYGLRSEPQQLTFVDDPDEAARYVRRGAANAAAKRLGGTVVTRCVTVRSVLGDYQQHPMVILVNGRGYYRRGYQGRPRVDRLVKLAQRLGICHEV